MYRRGASRVFQGLASGDIPMSASHKQPSDAYIAQRLTDAGKAAI